MIVFSVFANKLIVVTWNYTIHNQTVLAYTTHSSNTHAAQKSNEQFTVMNRVKHCILRAEGNTEVVAMLYKNGVNTVQLTYSSDGSTHYIA